MGTVPGRRRAAGEGGVASAVRGQHCGRPLHGDRQGQSAWRASCRPERFQCRRLCPFRREGQDVLPERTDGFRNRRGVCEFTRMYFFQPTRQGKPGQTRQTICEQNCLPCRKLRPEVLVIKGLAETPRVGLSIRWLRVRVPSPSLAGQQLTTSARDASAREVWKLPEFGNALGTLQEPCGGTVTRNPPAGWQPDEGIS